MTYYSSASFCVSLCAIAIWSASGDNSPSLKTPPCALSLDLMFLQDTTQSYEDDFPVLLPQLELLFSSLFEKYPSANIGIAEFKDKPILPFGWTEDYCYKLKSPLTADKSQLHSAFADLYASGGDDLPENQYGALITLAEDGSVLWRDLTLSDEEVSNGVKKARLIIMSTDSTPHYDGDAHSVELPKSYVVNDGHLSSVDGDCSSKRYPVYSQVSQALKDQNIKLGTMTPDEDPEVTGTWTWFNEVVMSQPEDFNQVLASDSSNFAMAVSNIVNSFAEEVCTGISLQTSNQQNNVVYKTGDDLDLLEKPSKVSNDKLKINDNKKLVLNVRGKGHQAMNIDMDEDSVVSKKNKEVLSGARISNIDE